MVPVNQSPLSLKDVNCVPSGLTRIADKPPKPLNDEVRIRPERNSSAPKRLFDLSAGSNASIGRARTFSEEISATRASRVCALSGAAPMRKATARNPATALRGLSNTLDRKLVKPARRRRPLLRCRRLGLAEQLGKLFGDRATEFLGVDDSHRAAVVAGDVMADADRDQLHRAAGLDLLDDMTQMPLEIVTRVDRQR